MLIPALTEAVKTGLKFETTGMSQKRRTKQIEKNFLYTAWNSSLDVSFQFKMRKKAEVITKMKNKSIK